MKLVRLGQLLWAMLLLAQLPTHAAAEEDANYTKAISRGIAEFEDRNFPEARAHFAQAHAIDPSARTSRALGMAEFELKNYVDGSLRRDEGTVFGFELFGSADAESARSRRGRPFHAHGRATGNCNNVDAA